MYGIVDATWTTGVLGGAWLIARLIGPGTTDGALARWMFASLGVLSAVIILVGSVQAVLWIVPLYLIGGALNGAENVMMGTLMGRRTPPEARGRASAAIQSRINGGALVGFILGGVLLEVVTPRWMILGAGIVGVVAVLVVTPLVLRVSRPAPAPAPVPIV
jgi:MFS family permease